jgi:hypothetical protein
MRRLIPQLLAAVILVVTGSGGCMGCAGLAGAAQSRECCPPKTNCRLPVQKVPGQGQGQCRLRAMEQAVVPADGAGLSGPAAAGAVVISAAAGVTGAAAVTAGVVSDFRDGDPPPILSFQTTILRV